jgi:hypothetical protein
MTKAQAMGVVVSFTFVFTLVIDLSRGKKFMALGLAAFMAVLVSFLAQSQTGSTT